MSVPTKKNSFGTTVLDTSGMEVAQNAREFWCFVSDSHRIMTTGFLTEEQLRQKANSFLATEKALDLFRTRYEEERGVTIEKLFGDSK